MAFQVLTEMVLKDQRYCLIVGVASDLVPQVGDILQYADDTVICITHDYKRSINLRSYGSIVLSSCQDFNLKIL
jgi:hypothetical protein